jgi:SAM-dependent methyltransferase
MNKPVADALRVQVAEYARHAATLQLAFVGVSGGLLEGLADGPRTPEALAEHTGTSAGYVLRWCEAAFAFGLLDATPPGYALSELGAAFRPSDPSTLMPMAVQSVLGAHMAERSASYLKSGERPGERVLAECDAVLPWFGPMLEASFGGLFERHVLGLPPIAALADRPGLAVDLGCGNGWYLRRLLARFPQLTGLGVDGFDANVRQACARAEAEGLGERARFAVADLVEAPLDEPALLIAMNRALHHVWEQRSELFARLRASLRPDGVLAIWEPAWPVDPAALRTPRLMPLAFQNLSEHVQGNHFLRPAEIAAAMVAAGLVPTIYTFADGAEAVVIARR